jgi:hypothetical protein
MFTCSFLRILFVLILFNCDIVGCISGKFILKFSAFKMENSWLFITRFNISFLQKVIPAYLFLTLGIPDERISYLVATI